MKGKNGGRPLIGIVISEPDFSFYTKALYHIQKELFSQGADAAVFNMLMTYADQMDVEYSVLSLVNTEQVDGLIVFGNTLMLSNKKAELETFIERSGIPAVYVEENKKNIPSVMFDADECADMIVRHLVEWHNVREVCYVSGPEYSTYHKRTLKSFHKALASAGIELTGDRIFYGIDWIGDYSEVAENIIRHGIPDAVICCSDFTAAGVIGALAERGVNIPEDVIVTGNNRNEPLEADYINITTVDRRPESMAVEAVGKLMALIKGEEYVPAPKRPSCMLRKGVTCGCEKINYPALARAAMDGMLSNRRSGFDSYYNSMPDTLMSAGSMEEMLWKLDGFTGYLGDFKGFWICLNQGVMHVPGERLEGYSDRMMVPYSKVDGEAQVGWKLSFDRKELLPKRLDSDGPVGYIINCLHYGRVNYGYTVLSYGDSGALFDKHYIMWLRYAAGAMDKQRRQIIYNDVVSDEQIRDSLTGLMNVRGFKKVMGQQCGRFDNPDKLMRIISVDVENLRGINSAYGYSEGDKVLQKLAMVLNNSAGEDDICVRVSGDEFFIAGLLDAKHPIDEVPATLQRNLETFNKGTTKDYGVHFFTSRVTAPVTSEEILDTLPYEANYQRTLVKDNRNKQKHKAVRETETEKKVFDPEERKAVAKILNDDLLTYHFQPIVSAKTGDIVAYEGLMRSAGEVKLSPVAILDHASAMGRLDDVERHTMCNLFGYYHEHKDLFKGRKLFINSIPSCPMPDKEFEELCNKYNDILDKLVIEFTEQTEASSEQLDKVLERREKYGFRVAIDDYGTGYSNISNLLTFMPNCVKIDRSLIMDIHEDKRKQHFAQNIIDYAHDNEFMALAEGVEKVEELRTLIGMGIDLIQGYLTAKPSPEVITSIDRDIKNKIKECAIGNENKRARKTYFTGSESEDELALMALDFENYTEIFVSMKDLTIKGVKDYVSDTTIRVVDDLDGKIKLEDVAISDNSDIPAIVIGKHSRLTLEIAGVVELKRPIFVPAGSQVDIVGSGKLKIDTSAVFGYCIGTDIFGNFGSIGLHMDGEAELIADGERCVCIGGGSAGENSYIDISGKKVEILVSGKHVVAIGGMENEVRININDTELYVRLNCSTGICIGSGGSSAKVIIKDSVLRYDGFGDTVSGINSFTDMESTVCLENDRLEIMLMGKNVMGIGSPVGRVGLDARKCEFEMVCEGARALGIGYMNSDSSISLAECTGRIRISTSEGACIWKKNGKVELNDCDIECIENK